jgi:DNA-binding response OmpR family regulator
MHQAVPMNDPPCVLVAEDDNRIRSVVATALRKRGYVVVERRDAAELIDHLDVFTHPMACEDFDLIISDIRIPGANGLELLEVLKRSKRCPPTILITGFSHAETHAEAYWLGPAGILDKPFEIDELLDRVDEVLF